jgi:hypothetical protein
MNNILNKATVLVLNRNWQAINIRTPAEQVRIFVHVRKTIRMGDFSRCKVRANSKPFSRGMPMSKTMMSGLSSRRSSKAIFPSDASPTTWKSWCSSMISRNPRRNTG